MKNVKIILATATKELDEQLKKTDGIEVVEEAFYREGIILVLKKVLQKSPEALPEVIVISESLGGRLPTEELIKEIRGFNCRIVYLPGMVAEMSQFIVNAACLGVVNIMFDPIEIPKLAQLIKFPPAQADVLREWGSLNINVDNRVFEEKLISRKSIEKHIIHTDKGEKTTSGNSPKLTILLATGDDSINESISTSHPCRPVIALSRESLLEKASNVKPDIIILSYLLPGELDILEVVCQAREITDKVIYLSGNMPDNDITLVRIRELGVEALTGDVSIGAVMRSICRLSGMAERQYDEMEGDQGEEQEGTITRLARVGTEIAKNIPNISVPKIRISKKTDINEKLVSVVSPLSAGKTFVSVNLATVLAGMGYTVALVDADGRQQSIHAWLNMGEYETGLADAVNSNEPLINAFRHQMVPNMYVFSTDPYIDRPVTVNTKGMSHLFESLQEESDIIIVDTSKNLNDPLNRFIIEVAASVILVADVDYSHLLWLQAELDRLENDLDFNKFSLMVNRAITCDNIGPSDAEKAAGLAADGIIPEKTKEALESIKNGIPASLFCLDIKNALSDYWERRGGC